jgi:small-conductance mechanosensitive channel
MHDTLAPPGLLLVTIVALVVTRGRGLLTKMAVETALLLAIGTFLLWQGSSPLPHLEGLPVDFAGAWVRALAIIWWLVGASLAANISVLVRGRDPKSRQARLFSELIAAAIYTTSIFIILNSVLDLNVASLLATSGVVAIILGLALQNTLADVFAGIAVGLDQPFHVGDRVSLGDGVEGVIVELNWRSIRIETDGDDLATIPNSTVARSQLINRSKPTGRRADTLEVVTPSEVAPGTVFELMRQATLLCPSVLSDPSPSITIRQSGLETSTYAVSFFVADSAVLSEAKSTLLRQTRRLFRHAGIGRPARMPHSELLGSLILFEALSPAELEALAAALIVHSTEPGEVIFEQGDVATSIFVIEAGVMEIWRYSSELGAQMLGRLGAGEYVGELGLITNSPRAFTLRSLTRARVLELPGVSLRDLLQSNEALNAAMERSVRRGLDMLDRDDGARATLPSEQTPDLFARIRLFFQI